MSERQRQPSTLLTLPPEIRASIYEWLAASPNTLTLCILYQESLGVVFSWDGHQAPSLNLLKTCRQIRYEYKHYLQRHATLQLSGTKRDAASRLLEGSQAYNAELEGIFCTTNARNRGWSPNQELSPLAFSQYICPSAHPDPVTFLHAVTKLDLGSVRKFDLGDYRDLARALPALKIIIRRIYEPYHTFVLSRATRRQLMLGLSTASPSVAAGQTPPITQHGLMAGRQVRVYRTRSMRRRLADIHAAVNVVPKVQLWEIYAFRVFHLVEKGHSTTQHSLLEHHATEDTASTPRIWREDLFFLTVHGSDVISCNPSQSHDPVLYPHDGTCNDAHDFQEELSADMKTLVASLPDCMCESTPYDRQKKPEARIVATGLDKKYDLVEKDKVYRAWRRISPEQDASSDEDYSSDEDE